MTEQVLTVEQWAKCSAVLTAGTGKTLNNKQMDVWYDTLCDLPYQAVQVACVRALQECETGFLPPIAIIRRFAVEHLFGALPQAADEWTNVLTAIKRFGLYRPADGIGSLSPISQRIVRSIGWGTLCGSDNISVQAAQFRMGYEAAAKVESNQRRLSVDVRPKIAVESKNEVLIEHKTKLAIAFELPNEVTDEPGANHKRRTNANHG